MFGPIRYWNDFLAYISIAPVAKKRRKPRLHRFQPLEAREMFANYDLGVTASTQSIPVGGSGYFDFTVTPADNDYPVTVNYGLSSAAATYGVDYKAIPTGATTSLVMAPGQTSASVEIDNIDTNPENYDANYSVSIWISGGDNVSTNYFAFDPISATMALDNPPMAEPTVTIGNASGDETDGSMDFTVTLSAPVNGSNVDVTYSTVGGSAVAGTDYLPVTDAVATISAGQSTGSLAIALLDDDTVETNEPDSVSLSVTLLGASATVTNVVIGSPSLGVGTISEDDDSSKLPSVTISNASAPEKSGSMETFNVLLSPKSDEPVTVPWTTHDGSATSGVDYDSSSGSVIFTAGQTSATVAVTVLDDGLLDDPLSLLSTSNQNTAVTPGGEAKSTFTVNLTAPSNATLANSSGTGTIYDPNYPANQAQNCVCTCGCPGPESTPSAPSGNNMVKVTSTGGVQTNDIPNLAPHPVITVQDVLSPNIAGGGGAPAATDVEMLLTFGPITESPVYYSASGYVAGQRVDFAEQVDAGSLTAGQYAWTMNITEQYADSALDVSRSYDGTYNLQNLDQSPFGRGWLLNGLDRLYPSSSGVELADGTGNMYWFASNGGGAYTSPANAPNFSTLTASSSGAVAYTLTDANQDVENFNTAGYLIDQVDSQGNTTSYDFSSGYLVNTVDQEGRTTTYAYETVGTLTLVESITDIEGRTTDYSYDSDGNVLSIIGPNPGNGEAQLSVSFTYANGNVATITDADGATSFHYDSYGGLTSVVDPEGHVTSYDAPQDQMLPPPGKGTSPTNLAPLAVDSQITGKQVDGDGHTMTYSTGIYGEITESTDAAGDSTSTSYNAAGEPLEIIGPELTSGPYASQPNLTKFVYDQNGNVIQEDLPNGATELWSYDTHWNEVTQFIDPMGRVTDYTLDSNTGNILSMRQVGNGAPDRVTTYTYTPKPTGQGQTPGGLLATETDPRGIETEWFYNMHGLVTEMVEAANSTAPTTLTYGYDSQDDLTYSTNELGATTSYHVDYLGRTIETDLPAVAAGQPVTWDSYDALGRLASETQLQSVSGTASTLLITDYKYEPSDGDTPLVKEIDKIGQTGTITTTYSVETFVYDSADNLIQSVDGMGRTTAYEFDSVNRQIAQQDPSPTNGSNNGSFNINTANGPVNSVTYDPLGNVVAAVNARGYETDNVYDLDGNLLSTTGPAPTAGSARPVTAYSYNYDDEKMTETSPMSGVTYFTYNSFGELVEEQDPSPDGKQLGPATLYQYDSDGNLVAQTGPNGATTQFIYNDRNEMVEEIGPSPDGTVSGPTTQWMYDLAGQVTQLIDAAGRVTEYEYDADGNLTATIAPNLSTGGAGDASTKTTDAYDLAGDKISETSPTPNGASLSATTLWQLNALGEVTQETDPTPASGGVAPVWQYQYNAAEELTKTIDPLNRTQTVAFDGLGRTASQVDYTGVTTDWSYDDMSNVLGETVGVGTTLAQTTTNAYDALDELLSTTAPNTGVTSYKYDLNGNMTSLTDSANNTTTWQHDLLNRVTSETTPKGTNTYQYDASSNLVQTVDADGRVIQYQYDALNRQTAEIWQQVAVSTATAGYGGHTDTAYSLVLPTAATGGTWTVTAANQTTVALPYNATAAEVKIAIAALSSVGQGNVSVSGLGSPAQPFVVTFTGALAASAVSLSANYSSITTGSGSQPGSSTQTSWGGPGSDEQEVVGYAATGSYGVTGGEFDLTYNGQTRAVAFNATPGDVKSALAEIGLTDIEVTGPSGSGIGSTGAAVYTITFVGSQGGKYLPPPVTVQNDPSSPLVDSASQTSDISVLSAVTVNGSDEVDAVQQIVVTQTSGSFALSYGGESTPGQSVGESAANLQTALEGLPGLAQVTVTGSGTVASPYLVTFAGDLKGESVPLLGGGNNANIITTAYNADGSISSIGDSNSHYAYTYDGQGNTASVDNAGTPNVPRVVLTSQFDAAANRASLAATINGKADFANTYNYDALSRVTQIEQSGVTNGNTVAYKELDYSFDPLGDVVSRTAFSTSNTPRTDAATGQYGYNTLGQLTSLGYTSNSGTTAIDNFAWSFDSLGRVSTFSSIDGTATYGYDNVNEVTSANYTTNPGETQPADLSFSFDANGNRAKVDGTQTTMGVNNEVTNDGTYAYTFDADGNMLTETPDTGAPPSDHPASFTYDYRNRLVEVQEFNNATPPTLTEQINYVYDVFNRLIERDDDVIGGNTTDTHYVWDQLSPLPPGALHCNLVKTGSCCAVGSVVVQMALGRR